MSDLQELSDKATPGPWFTDELDRLYVGNRADGRTHGLWSIIYSTADRMADLVPERQQRHRVDAAFIVALVNAFRAGELVPAGPVGVTNQPAEPETP